MPRELCEFSWGAPGVEWLVYDLHHSGSLALGKRKPCSRSGQKIEKVISRFKIIIIFIWNNWNKAGHSNEVYKNHNNDLGILQHGMHGNSKYIISSTILITSF